MTQRFSSQASWRPMNSVLALFIRRVCDDRRQAEAWFLIVLSTVVVLSVIAQFLAWSLWHERIATSWFWSAQVTSAVLVLTVGMLGFAPGVTASVGAAALRVTQGRRSVNIHYSCVRSCTIVSAEDFHRVHASAVVWDRFIARMPEDVLLIESDAGRIAVGISSDAHVTIESLIDIQHLQVHAV